MIGKRSLRIQRPRPNSFVCHLKVKKVDMFVHIELAFSVKMNEYGTDQE